MKNKKSWDYILLIILILIGSTITLVFAIQGLKLEDTKQNKQFFLAFEMLLGTILLYVPDLFEKIFKLSVPKSLKVLYWLFIYFAVFIGTGFHYYGKFFYWDKLLHISSSMLLVALGFAIMGAFVKNEVAINIHPAFFAIFAFCFGLAMGVFWEFYEFTFDGLLSMNMQRFAESNGKELIGRVALMDTMGDLFIDGLGSLIFAIYGYIQMKRNKNWLDTVAFKKIKETS